MLLRTVFAPFLGRRTNRTPSKPGARPLAPVDLPPGESLQRLAQGRKVVIVSNRGPVEFVRGEEGRQEPRKGSGGLATLLWALAHGPDFSWVVSPMSDGDRTASKGCQDGRVEVPVNGGKLALRFVLTSQAAHDRHYSVFANPLLWFLQHCMWDLAHTPTINAATYDAWEHGYVPVNQAFADAVVQELTEGQTQELGARGRPVVLFNDYHLYLAPGYVRERVPEAVLQHFIHIPWPAPRYWLLLPAVMRLPIIHSLCQNDIVGFQTARDVSNFLSTCEAYLPDATVDFRARTVWLHGRTVYARCYPVSIDVAAVRETAFSAGAESYREKLEPLRADHTIVRVDRLELSKNVNRGFIAFDGLLNRYPELAGRVKFLAFLVPSRTDLKQYKDYKKEVFALAEQINERHGNDAWQPIEIFYEHNYQQALAAMRMYDVLLVNPVIDGMNLVAKEGPTVNERDGVLIISEGAGAHEQLGTHALSVGPTDVEGTIRALHQAITMPLSERKERAQGLRAAVEKEDLEVWIRGQVADLLGVLTP